MSDILADYREWRDAQPTRIGTHSDRCHMWERHERCMIHRLARRLEEAALTDAEREAVEWALTEAVWSYNPDCGEHPATLRGLLERLR